MSRYIDADRLIKEAEQDGAYGYVSAEQIDAQPTADVRENVKGEWISESLACTNGGTYRVVRCNKCYESQLLESNFCPNCGADMRGGDAE